MFMKKVTYVVLVLGLVLNIGTMRAVAVPILSIGPPSMTVQPNQGFSLNIRIADITDLYAFQFDLAFNPTILSAASVTEGPFLPSGGSTVFILEPSTTLRGRLP